MIGEYDRIGRVIHDAFQKLTGELLLILDPPEPEQPPPNDEETHEAPTADNLPNPELNDVFLFKKKTQFAVDFNDEIGRSFPVRLRPPHRNERI